ncbi:VQ motif-containing protein 20 [Hibiscus trionum]|uniref:VQ motif-containing protein 20 n=1 Tax=Hibiscus trionum TaxID=183268 RepID=A0A9W7HF76_HIBTR|nr:VQ motif-containing protein 20 [Hibiscus trionum]
MNQTQLHDQQHRHAKKDTVCPPPLKVSKDSHLIKKSSSSSSSSSAASSLGVTGAVKPQQQRHPVIIYTHSPKVIHTHPKDFMALVQKLTGMSRNEEDHNRAAAHQPKAEASAEEDSKRISSDDNESSSVITDENCEGQVNSSCFVAPPLFDPPAAPFLTNIPVFTPNSADFLCVNHHPPPFYNYTDSLFFTPNMRSSISSSSSGLEGMNEFHDY